MGRIGAQRLRCRNATTFRNVRSDRGGEELLAFCSVNAALLWQMQRADNCELAFGSISRLSGNHAGTEAETHGWSSAQSRSTQVDPGKTALALLFGSGNGAKRFPRLARARLLAAFRRAQ